ncbi:putative carbohydrate binding domain containing protein [uncultured Mediterranean phage]|nr:putative carbohydrate binding domain containing protein [uncultured Mediterranean phage]
MTKAAELAKMGEVLTNSQIGRKNIIVNGAMQVAQRGTSSTGLGATDGYYTLDRFKVDHGATSAGRYTMTQSAVTDLNGFSNALKIDCTTADTSIAAGEGLFLNQKIEGLACQQLKSTSTSTNAFTLSFYAKSNASRAIASEILMAEGTNRHASKLHTIGTSWARYTMTVPAASSTEIDNDNTEGMAVQFIIHGGSTYTGGTIAGTTLTSLTNANRAVGIGSIFASTDNTLEITGVQLEVGSQATPFEHRSFGEELALCQRYFEKSYSVGTAPASDTSAGLITTDTMAGDTTTSYLAHQLEYRISKRAAPTVVIYDQAEATGKVTSHVTGVSTANGQTASTEHAGDKSISVLRASGDAANGFRFHYTADAEL